MKKIFFSLIVSFLAITSVLAQRTLSGKIVDDTGQGLPGVNVVIKGTTTGTTSDLDGNYRLEVNEGDVLIFSYVGFETQEVATDARTVVDISLSGATELEEVVVTAVGIERQKKALGYAVSSLDSDDVSQVSEPDPLRALTGKIAGVNILSSNGLPGGSTNMTIRGYSSLTGNNQPLFVVDGVPFDNSTFISRGTSANSVPDGAFGNRLLDIDPNNIESLTVLKGGAASALYGSRAANGVVVITTKGGLKQSQKGLEITVSSSFSAEEYANPVDVQTQYAQGGDFQFNPGFVGTWGERIDTLNARGGIPHPYAQGAAAGIFPEFAGVTIPARARNNAEEFFETGYVHENSIQITSGSEGRSVSIGASHMNNDGIAPNTSFQRTSVNFGGSAQLQNGLFVSGNFNYVSSKQQSVQIGTPLGGNNTSIMQRLLWTPVTVPLADLPFMNPLDNSNVYYRSDQDNPYWLAATSPYFSDVDRYFGNVSLSYDLADWLTASYRIGVNAYTDRRLNVIAAGSAALPNGEIIDDDIYRQEVDGLINLAFNKDLGTDFGLSANVGFNHNSRITERQAVQGTGIITFGIHDIDNTSTQVAFPVPGNQDKSERRLLGFYADITGDYRDWAFLTLTGRRDISSTLPESERAFNYGAVTASVVLTDALSLSSNILNFAKVRGNIARVGNDADPYLTQTIFLTNPTVGNGNLTTPFTNANGSTNVLSEGNVVGNSSLKPEFTTEYEAGLELQLLNNRVSVDAAYYVRRSTDQIVPIDVPASSGFNRAITNLGEVENSGLEVTLTATPIQMDNGLTWTMTHAFTRNRSEVLDLGELDEVFVGGFIGLGIVHREGLPYGQITGSDYERDPETGLPLVSQNTGLLIETASDRLIGDPNPDFNWSVNNTISWKGISLSFLLDWRKGGDQFCFSCDQLRSRGVVAETQNREAPLLIPGFVADPNDTSQPLLDGDGNKIPNTFQISANDYFFIDGVTWADIHDVYDISTIRLREVSIGYTFPKSILSNTPFGSASITFTGRNLWYEAYNTPTSLNYDPEVSSGVANSRGLDFATVPTTKRYGVNIKVTL